MRYTPRYTKTDLVFGFTGNQISVASYPQKKGAEDFTRTILYRILSENHYQVSIILLSSHRAGNNLSGRE